jgi:hypothetical protein
VHLAIENVDLAALATCVQRRFGRHLYASYLRGKTLMRDAVVEELRCSAYEAEELVETLELQGYVRFPQLADHTHALTRDTWVITEEPV